VIAAAPLLQLADGVPANGSAGGPLAVTGVTGVSGSVVSFTAGVAVPDARAEADDFTIAATWCRQDGGAKRAKANTPPPMTTTAASTIAASTRESLLRWTFFSACRAATIRSSGEGPDPALSGMAGI
jgi:hypothetical protein